MWRKSFGEQQAALTSRLMGPNAFKRTHCCCHLNSAGALLGFFEIRYKKEGCRVLVE
jgi:hypothetical protein